MDNKDYFSRENEKKYMSYSQFKDFLECEEMALAKAEGRFSEPPSKAMLQGSYIDAHFSNEMEEFTKEHGDLFKKDGTLKSDYEICNKVIEAIERDNELLDQFYSGESQRIVKGTISGVPFKGKIDMLYPTKIVDMKAMASLEPVWDEKEYRKKPFYSLYRYDLQAAIYQELVRQETGMRLPYYLAVATKEKVPQKKVYLFSQEVLDNALNQVRELAPRFQKIKNHELKPNCCGKCEWCLQNKKFDIFDIKTITMEEM